MVPVPPQKSHRGRHIHQGGTYTKETFNEAACAILDALANSSIAPIAKYVRAEGAAEIYPRQPNRDRIGVEATDVSLYGYAQFVLKTGRRPAKVARPRDHHKRGRVFHTTSRDIVGLLNTLRVDMKTLSVKRNASPYNDLIPGFLDLWATWNDRDTRAAIIAFAGYRGKVTHVLWPSFDPTPVDFVETTDFAVTGLALIRADYRPPATQHVPTADALFPRFDHDSTQAAYDHATDSIRDPLRPGRNILGTQYVRPDDNWLEGTIDMITHELRGDHGVRMLQLKKTTGTLRGATIGQLASMRHIDTLTPKIVDFFDDNYVGNVYEALLRAEAVFARSESKQRFAAPPSYLFQIAQGAKVGCGPAIGYQGEFSS